VTTDLGLVLVHGGTHASDCWDEVRSLLRRSSVAVDLPGRGSRPFEGQVVTLADCVDAVLEDADRAGFDRFVLAGHSMGGLTISEVAFRHPERVAHLIYVDAIAFPPGVTQRDYMEHVTGVTMAIDDLTGRFPPLDRAFIRGATMPDLDDDRFEAAYAALVPEPYGMFVASISGFAPDVPATYLRCLHETPEAAAPKAETEQQLRAALRSVEFLGLEADHGVMLSQPQLLADHLERVASRGDAVTLPGDR
jgi:pimeloyl-ACP methyl ester carboxylesterase